MEHFDIPSQRFAADLSTVVDVPGHSAPGVEPIQGVRSFEDFLCGAADAAAEETSDCRVDEVHLLTRQSKANGLHKPLGADSLQFLLLRPFEDSFENRAPGNEVAFCFAFPGEAALDTVEAVFFAGGQLVVEEAFALLEL